MTSLRPISHELPTGSVKPARERKVKGVSNQHSVAAFVGGGLGTVTTTSKPRRLCRFPDPKAQVARDTSPDMHDPRHIDSAIIEAGWKRAPESHKFAVPPALPSAKAVLGTMREVAPDTRLLHAGVPGRAVVRGIPGMVEVSPTAEDVVRVPVAPPTLLETKASPPRRVTGEPSPLRKIAPPTAPSETGSRRLTAAEVFLQGDAVLPRVPPPPLKPPVEATKGRGGCATRAETLWMTQSVPGTASYAPPDARFDRNTCGLGCGLVAQQDKLRAQVASEVKTAVRRAKEAAVIASRTAEGERQLRIEEGRIRSKAAQAAEYRERLSHYKYTS